MVSGLPAARFTFDGFLPRGGRERRTRLERIAAEDRAIVLFEAPGRSATTLADLAAACGPDRRAVLCRELTKMYEEIWRGTLGELAERAAATPPRGEVTIVVAGADRPADEDEQASPEALAAGRAEVSRLVSEGWTRPSAAREVAQRTGLPRRDLFRS